MTISRGLWIADPPSLVLRDDYLERLHALQLAEHFVMIDGPAPGLSDAYWNERQLAQFAAKTATWPAKRVLSAWVAPQRPAILELRARLSGLLLALQAQAFEGDGEGVWTKNHLNGYMSLDSAGGALAEVVRAAVPTPTYEITTYPSIFRRLLSASRYADRINLQCYSVTPRQGQVIPYDGSLGPSRFPVEALTNARADLLLAKLSNIELGCGLALYHQNWHSRPDTVALDDAKTSALEGLKPEPCQRLVWWSSAFVVGSQRIQSRYDWLKSTKPA